MEHADPTPPAAPQADDPAADGGAPPPDKAATLRSERAEIAEEPGNHGVFAMGCSLAVVLALIAFFAIRLLVMR